MVTLRNLVRDKMKMDKWIPVHIMYCTRAWNHIQICINVSPVVAICTRGAVSGATVVRMVPWICKWMMLLPNFKKTSQKSNGILKKLHQSIIALSTDVLGIKWQLCTIPNNTDRLADSSYYSRCLTHRCSFTLNGLVKCIHACRTKHGHNEHSLMMW